MYRSAPYCIVIFIQILHIECINVCTWLGLFNISNKYELDAVTDSLIFNIGTKGIFRIK